MTAPTVLANLTDYPDASDLTDYIDVETSSAALTAQAADFVAEATETMLSRVPLSALPADYRPGGAIAKCPYGVRRAIIMYAGRLFGRRASLMGVIMSTEDFIRISNVDPDIERLMGPWQNWPEA